MKNTYFKYFLVLFSTAFIGCVITSVILISPALSKKVNAIPPIPFAVNLIIDEKIRLIKSKNVRNVDWLGIGSSMTLSNFSSEELLKALPAGTTYFNIGVWGNKINHSRGFYNFFKTRFNPKVVLLVTSCMDFYGDSRKELFNLADVNDYLESDSHAAWYAFKSYDLLRVIKDYRFILNSKSTRHRYDSLQFDEWGAIPLEVSESERAPDRWNSKCEPLAMQDQAYAELDLWASEVKKDQRKFVVVQAPIRDSSMTPLIETQFQVHVKKMKDILGRNDAIYVDLHHLDGLTDLDFADYSHLNLSGTIPFTRKAMQEINQHR